MHWSITRTFSQFLTSYVSEDISVLEIGSANVNGGLRELKRPGMTWWGVDLDDAPGVDQVVQVGAPLPFENQSFDLVVASSVFEHDIQFWNTFLEMARVMKPGGTILITAPSQGYFHRHIFDAFRFYPDAGIALEKWAAHSGKSIKLIESFTTLPENSAWADYVAIFSDTPERYRKSHIGGLLKGENWIVEGELKQDTYREIPYDMRRISELEAANLQLAADLDRTRFHISALLNEKSWKITKQIRIILLYVKKIIGKF